MVTASGSNLDATTLRAVPEPWGFDSLSFRLSSAGLVQGQDSWLPTGRSGFDSPIPHSIDVMVDASLAERSGAGFPGSTGGFNSRGALSTRESANR